MLTTSPLLNDPSIVTTPTGSKLLALDDNKASLAPLFITMHALEKSPACATHFFTGVVVRVSALKKVPVSFFNKANLLEKLNSIPRGSEVIVDFKKNKYMSYDIDLVLEDFKVNAQSRQIDLKFINKP